MTGNLLGKCISDISDLLPDSKAGPGPEIGGQDRRTEAFDEVCMLTDNRIVPMLSVSMKTDTSGAVIQVIGICLVNGAGTYENKSRSILYNI